MKRVILYFARIEKGVSIMKVFLCLILATLSAFLFTGCAQVEQQPITYEEPVDMNLSGKYTSKQGSQFYDISSYGEITPPPTQTIQLFSEESIELEYCEDTSYGDFYSSYFPLLQYKGYRNVNNKEKEIVTAYFTLDGKCVVQEEFNNLPEEVGNVKWNDELLVLAKAHLLERWNIDVTGYAEEISRGDTGTWFTFTKKFGNIATVDEIEIRLRNDGVVTAVRAPHYGLVPNDTKIDDIDIEAIKTAVWVKAKQMGLKGYIPKEHEPYFNISSMDLMVLEDGSRIMQCVAFADYYSINGYDSRVDGHVKMLHGSCGLTYYVMLSNK